MLTCFVQQPIKDIVDKVRHSLETVQSKEESVKKDGRIPQTNLIDFTLSLWLAQFSEKIIQ